MFVNLSVSHFCFEGATVVLIAPSLGLGLPFSFTDCSITAIEFLPFPCYGCQITFRVSSLCNCATYHIKLIASPMNRHILAVIKRFSCLEKDKAIYLSC